MKEYIWLCFLPLMFLVRGSAAAVNSLSRVIPRAPVVSRALWVALFTAQVPHGPPVLGAVSGAFGRALGRAFRCAHHHSNGGIRVRFSMALLRPNGVRRLHFWGV